MYQYLKGRMTMAGLDGKTLAAEVGLSPVSLSRKLNGHTEFTRTEMWAIIKALGADGSEMASLFPEGGQNEIQRDFSGTGLLPFAGERGSMGAGRNRVRTIRPASDYRAGNVFSNRH